MDRQDYQKERAAEGKLVQEELERQLRAFGDTMSDAFAHGFEGRGMDIGDRAWDVGRAAASAAGYGIGEAAKGFRKARDEARQSWAKQTFNEGRVDADTSGMPDWFRRVFGLKTVRTPVEEVRFGAKKCLEAGGAMLAVGITFASIFGIAGIGALVIAGSVTPLTQAVGGEMLYTFLDGELLSSVAVAALGISGSVFTVIACGFGTLIAAGASRLSAGKKLRLFADAAEGMDYHKGLPVELLADLTHQKKAAALKNLRKYIQKGWLSAWLDEKTDNLYLTAEDYRAAQQARAEAEAAASKAQPEQAAEKAQLNLEAARRFAAVLEQEKQLMQDAQGVEELEHMRKTTKAICDWLDTHPESLPKARRFAEYYIPTTLKLLHTYNDVQGQQGDNAENIRRDIAGILHTLNQAYDNLYDNLLSDVAMDISSEIAALQGMLANDGLTGEGTL